MISDANNALLSVLPEVPIASSQATGWDKIQLAHYRQPPHILPEISSPHHTICINIGGPVLLEHVVDGHIKTIHSETGDIGLYPANFKQSVQWDRETEFLQLYLEPTRTIAFSYEYFGCDRIEIPPQLTFFDPLIYHIGLALLTALEIDGVQSRLYAESMANALAVHLVSRYSTRERAIPDFVLGVSPRNFQQVIDYINEHLEHNLSLAELANVVQLSVENAIAENDKVAFRSTIKGTHKGDFMGIPPTGKSINASDLNLFRISEGKIVEWWYELNLLEVMKQIGVISDS